MSDPKNSSQRIAIIGPTHPYKGGIAMETTELAHRLQASGADVTLYTWTAQYPTLLYPGNQFVPNDKPERPLFERTIRQLSWKNPFSWWQLGRQLRLYDKVIFVWWLPTIQGPIYLSILKALGRGKGRPQRIVLCHNVLPHEGKPGDRAMTKLFMAQVDRLLVHTPAQATLAAQLTSRTVALAGLPLVLPSTVPAQPIKQRRLQQRLLFFGIIRPYKGLDVLLHALASLPDIKLTIAGEFWGGSEPYQKLVQELGLKQRVTIHPGYATDEQLAQYFAESDALVLPYRGGTASQNVGIGHAYGVPVIATTAGSMAEQIRPNVDGLLCQPDDVASLAGAIGKFYEPGVAAKLQSGIPTVATETGWQTYLTALLG
jgi:glycosyltransferase involved in cell wall biosynthesis